MDSYEAVNADNWINPRNEQSQPPSDRYRGYGDRRALLLYASVSRLTRGCWPIRVARLVGLRALSDSRCFHWNHHFRLGPASEGRSDI